jgi:hypothetical protein
MLREILAVRQDKPGLRRHWYQDEFFDLYTWHSRTSALVRFQLCYDVRGRERALTWSKERGFSHNKIDSGAQFTGYPMTPLLAEAGRFPHRLVRARFRREAATLGDATRSFILDKMREFGRHSARGEIELPRRRRALATPPSRSDP